MSTKTNSGKETDAATIKEKNESNVTHLRNQAKNLPGLEEMETDLKMLDGYDDRLEAAKGKYMAQCKAIKAEMKEDLDDCRGRGVDTKVLKQVHKDLKILNKILGSPTNLGEDSGPVYEHYVEQLDMFGAVPQKPAKDPEPAPKTASK